MARSGSMQAELFKDENRAAGHDINGSVIPYDDVDAFSGAGAVISTGADIGRWMQMLLGQGSYSGRRVLAEDTVKEIFAASMVQGIGGPLHDPNDSAGMGCESYQFRGLRVIEKNGALDGVRTIVTLIPDRDIGIAVLANKHLTVFPEAVRAEFLEREIGPSGRDLQAQVLSEQPAWEALMQVPKPPADAAPLAHDLDAFAGHYTSKLYGDVIVARNGPALELHFGPNAYPARLSHWSGDTFLIRFKDPDVTPGLLTFALSGAKRTGLDGSNLLGVPGGDLGHFEAVPRWGSRARGRRVRRRLLPASARAVREDELVTYCARAMSDDRGPCDGLAVRGRRVFACFAGANRPCGELDPRRALPAVTAWCARNPGVVVPASVSGHASVWRWRCDGSQAVRGELAWHGDASGFAEETWKALDEAPDRGQAAGDKVSPGAAGMKERR